jgi:hypothetical protein
MRGGSEDEGGGMQAALNILGASRRLGKEMEAKERGDRLATRTAAAAGSLSHPLWTCNVFFKILTKAVSSNTNAAENFNQSVFWGGEKNTFFCFNQMLFHQIL